MRIRLWPLAVVLASVCVLPAPGQAADSVEENRTRAREFYRLGTQHYDLAEYPQALESFKEGFRVSEDPSFLYNIGQCYRLIGDRQQAVAAYKSYLRRLPSAPNEMTVREMIARLEKESSESPDNTRTQDRGPTVVPATTASGGGPVPSTATTQAMEPNITSVPIEAGSPEAQPAWKKGWFWGAIGAGVAVVVVVAVLASGGGSEASPRTLPELRPQ